MLDQHCDYPAYSLPERIADGSIHALGVIGALIGAVVLIVWTVSFGNLGQTTAVAIYGAALIATFSASAIYHMTPVERFRPIFRRFDHAAIFLKIAGTYTPLVVMIGGFFAYGILAIVWALALFGIITRLFFWQTPGRFGAVLYLCMGWLSVPLIGYMIPALPASATVLIIAGGLLYTCGVGFFIWESLRFSNAIWHGFVCVASACFYGAILLGLHSGSTPL